MHESRWGLYIMPEVSIMHDAETRPLFHYIMPEVSIMHDAETRPLFHCIMKAFNLSISALEILIFYTLYCDFGGRTITRI